MSLQNGITPFKVGWDTVIAIVAIVIALVSLFQNRSSLERHLRQK